MNSGALYSVQDPLLHSGEPRSLLRREQRPGHPPEYLYSRVRGRRSKLIRDWRAVLRDATPAQHLASAEYRGFVRDRTLEGMWGSLLTEHAWAFGQMDEELRCRLAPYFLYVELRTLCMCLRHRSAEHEQEVNGLLDPSLLSRELKELLRSAALPGLLVELEERFSALSPLFRGLSARYADAGLRSAERFLTDAYLEYVLTLPLYPVLRGLFIRLINSRNLLLLYKVLRFGAKDPATFIPGGTIAPDQLETALQRDDLFAVLPLLRQATGIALSEPDLTRLETALYRSITKHLRREGRDPLGMALVLDYLWQCSLEMTNLSLLFAGKDQGREEIAAELVY